MFEYTLILGDIIMDSGQIEADSEEHAEQLLKAMPGAIFDRYTLSAAR